MLPLNRKKYKDILCDPKTKGPWILFTHGPFGIGNRLSSKRIGEWLEGNSNNQTFSWHLISFFHLLVLIIY